MLPLLSANIATTSQLQSNSAMRNLYSVCIPQVTTPAKSWLEHNLLKTVCKKITNLTLYNTQILSHQKAL